jgi:hypothetical protein
MMLRQGDGLARPRSGIESRLSLDKKRLHDANPRHEAIHIDMKRVVDSFQELAFHGVDSFESDTTDCSPRLVCVSITKRGKHVSVTRFGYPRSIRTRP